MVPLGLFIAVPVTNQTILSNLAKFQQTFFFQGIRQVKPELFHFSLHFLGDTEESLVQDIQELVDTISAQRFTITLKGSGVFPNLHNIKVIWAGVQSGVEQLTAIQHQLTKPLEKLGFQLDHRPFSPHLTLGRVKFLKPDAKKAVQQTITNYKTELFGSQEIAAVHLMQSTLTPKGPIYQSLFHKELI